MSEALRSVPNRLANERSPYLLQHAYNPVDWYAWSDEAFERAMAENKPVFLSIGYSTCHWCHVMERESFESQAVADYLNAHFVSIKVDREERPDVDAIYMSAVQAMSGSGGWPMTVFLFPDRRPFFGGTYFPPTPAYGRPSFLQLLTRIVQLWGSERAALEESGTALLEAIQAEESTTQASIAIDKALVEDAYKYFVQTYDRDYGGFGNAPKFPRPVQFDFLFHYSQFDGDPSAEKMALHTLRHMALGGMYDQLGGGFHRYSVDRFWRVSHFEKMLYDQAQLVESYLDAFQITKDPFFADVAQGVCDYVLRDMTHAEGGFFSAEDADSEGAEGTFYVWTEQEIANVLGEDAKLYSEYFGVNGHGNFEHGKNVLHTSMDRNEAERLAGKSDKEFASWLAASSAKLFAHRAKRIRPHLDDKILASWNGLMIGALARAGSILREPRYVVAATRAASFLWTSLRDEQGQLLHRWREGESRFAAYLESYAFVVKGYLQLYEATFDEQWLEHAIELQDQQDRHLYDDERGAYFMSRASDDLIVRTKGQYDGAEPSGNSVAVHNLQKLYALTGNDSYRAKAVATLEYFGRLVGRHPYAMPAMMVAAMNYLKSPATIVLSGSDTEIEDFREVVDSEYLGSRTLARASGSPSLAESVREPQIGPRAMVCRDFVCDLPVKTPSSLRQSLARKSQNAAA